jgi:hypothetical protein
MPPKKRDKDNDSAAKNVQMDQMNHELFLQAFESKFRVQMSLAKGANDNGLAFRAHADLPVSQDPQSALGAIFSFILCEFALNNAFL